MYDIKKYLKLDTAINRNVFYILLGCMLALTISRIIVSLKQNSLIDFICYVDTANAVWHNRDPYDPQNLKNLFLLDWKSPSIVLPGTFLFFMPFVLIDLEAAKIIYLSLNIIAACCLVYLFFKKAHLLDNSDYKRPDVKTLLVLAMAVIFLNSTPVMMAIRHGQSTIFLTLFLVLCLYCPNKWIRIILFSLAAVTKYSMIPVLAPALFLKKNYLFCIAAFLLFLLFLISPVICGQNIINLYEKYIDAIHQLVSTGFNSYPESGYSMLNIGFFKLNFLNLIGKSFFGILALYIIFRDRRENSIGMNFLLVIMCITMLLSYHRLHDIHLIILIMMAELYFFILKKDKINILISAAFILFFAVPFSLIISISHLITKIPHLGDFFYTCNYYSQNKDVFPLSALVFLLFTTYSLYLFFFKKEEIIFELNPNHQPDNIDATP